MADTIGRTFYFSKSLWSLLDEDAKRCKRSSVKQLEAILETFYDVQDVEINKESLKRLNEVSPKAKKTEQRVEILGEIDPKGGEDLPYFEIDLTDKKKKSA